MSERTNDTANIENMLDQCIANMVHANERLQEAINYIKEGK